MDAKQRKHLSTLFQAAVKHDPAHAELKTKLLSLGGEDVVFFEPNEFAYEVLHEGKVYRKSARVHRQGADNHCHGNAVCLWKEGKKIATGYALSPDGLWRRHSWGIAKNGTAIETTVPRVLYFGYPLDRDDVQVFASLYGEEEGMMSKLRGFTWSSLLSEKVSAKSALRKNAIRYVSGKLLPMLEAKPRPSDKDLRKAIGELYSSSESPSYVVKVADNSEDKGSYTRLVTDTLGHLLSLHGYARTPQTRNKT